MSVWIQELRAQIDGADRVWLREKLREALKTIEHRDAEIECLKADKDQLVLQLVQVQEKLDAPKKSPPRKRKIVEKESDPLVVG